MAAALMIVLLIPGLLIKALLGAAVLIGLVASVGYLLCGLGLWIYRVFEIAGKEGMLFHVLLWTRAGRRFVYAQWRHYGKAALMMLQGVLLLALTVPVFLVAVATRPPRSEKEEPAPAVATEELSAEEIQKIQAEFDAIHAEQERIHDEIRAKARRRREEGKARLAEIRKRAQQSPEQRKQPLIDKYGADRVVTVIVEQAPVSRHAALVARIRNLAGTTELASHGRGDQLWLSPGPVTDLAALAAKIDFGQDVQVDEAQRTITVVADPGKLE